MLPYTALDGLAAMRASYGLPDAPPEQAGRRARRPRWFQRSVGPAADRAGAAGTETERDAHRLGAV